MGEFLSDGGDDADKGLLVNKKKKLNGKVDSILSFDGHENDVMMQYLSNLSNVQQKMESLERANRDMMETIQKEAEKADTFRRMSARTTPTETEDEYDDSSEDSDSDSKTQKKLERVLNKKLNNKKKTSGGFCSIF